MEKELKKAAGVLIVARESGRIFLLYRAPDNKVGSVWGLLSGTMEGDEEPLETIKRETYEEIKVNPNKIDYYFNGEEERSDGLIFYYFLGFVDFEFEPELNEENSDSGWFKKDELPEPLFPGLKEKINRL